MKRNILSELTGKADPTVEECVAAVKDYKTKLDEEKVTKEKLSNEKKARAAQVEEAYKIAKEAEKKYYDLRNAFVKDYGYFHTTYTKVDDTPFQDLLDFFFTI